MFEDMLIRTLVGIVVVYRHKDDPSTKPDRIASYSGTLIRLGAMTAILTAGHVVEGLQKLIASPNHKISSAVLADTFGENREHKEPIPFALEPSMMFYRDNEEAGLDFGLIALRDYYERLLAANGALVIDEGHWRSQSGVQFENCFVVGLPEEMTVDTVVGGDKALVQPFMFKVKSVAEEVGGATIFPRFVGRIEHVLGIGSVVGMSGGPIVGFSSENPTQYWVVAIQSSWRRSEGLVFGTPVPVIANFVLNVFANAVATSEKFDEPSH